MEQKTPNGSFYKPPVDIIQDDKGLHVFADMPGTSSNELEIKFEDGVLTIHGKVTTRFPKDARVISREYGVGDYFRNLRFDTEIDKDKISADYVDGVLSIFLPVKAAAQPRKIEICDG